jgi:hypothetical protein
MAAINPIGVKADIHAQLSVLLFAIKPMYGHF